MNKKEVRELLERLDRAVSKEGAAVKMVQYGGGADESRIVANESGYLRLGIEFMKLAFAKTGGQSGEYMVYPEFEYLITPDSTVSFDWCERRDSIDEERIERTWTDRIFPVVAVLVLLSIVALAGYGFVGLLGRLF